MSDEEQIQNKPALKDDDDEISLIDLFAVLWKRKMLIISITAVVMVGVLLYALLSLKLPPEKSFNPNVYTPQAHMLINDSSSSGGSLSSMINASGLGSLAGMMGINAGGGGATYSQLATYLVSSNPMLDSVVDEFDLITRYKVKKSIRAESRKALKKNLKAEMDDESGVFTISFTDIDPVFAQGVVNYCVAYLEKRFDELGVDKHKIEKVNLERNIEVSYKEITRLEQESHNLEQSVGRMYTGNTLPSISMDLNKLRLELEAQREIYKQLKVQYELLKVTMTSESPVFQVLEYAEVPDQKSGPSRGMLCIIVTFAAAFFSVFLAFVLNAIENIRKDPEAMAKLQVPQREKRRKKDR